MVNSAVSSQRDGAALFCFRGNARVARVVTASRFLSRLVGLSFRSGLAPDQALWIKPCYAIHSFGMRFRFDAVFLDSELRVLGILNDVRPWRICPSFKGTKSVLELAAGSARFYSLKPGDQLSFVGETLPE